MWISNGNGVHSGSSLTVMQTVLLLPSHVDRLSHESPPAALLYIKYDIKYPEDASSRTNLTDSPIQLWSSNSPYLGRHQNSLTRAAAKVLQHSTFMSYSFSYISRLQLAAEYGDWSK